jgi:hypothetical protein
VPVAPLWQPSKDGFLIITGIGLPYKAITRAATHL